MNLGEVPESPDPECRKCFDGEGVQEKAPEDLGKVSADPVEVALATALERASVAGEWAVVGQLARELEARRKSHEDPKVVPLRPPKREPGSS